VEINATLAADLAMLSETFDSDDDIVEGLRQLATDAKLAVRSYAGLTVIASNAALPMTLTAMEDAAYPVDVVSSLMMPLCDDDFDDANSRLVVILYAGRPGAFVDLAADLCWLTGRRLTDFVLDQHLNLPTEPNTAGGVQASSFVNQAIGVLLGHGYTPEQAESEIDARAAAAGHSRSDAADVILGSPPNEPADLTLGVR
jgi:hypothetical protein